MNLPVSKVATLIGELALGKLSAEHDLEQANENLRFVQERLKEEMERRDQSDTTGKSTESSTTSE